MRSYFESLERTTLETYATKSSQSKGRLVEEPHSPTRTVFQRDRDRIIHTKAFRRLKRKTQVFVVTISDHYRSRLTHTIEVAQLSRHLARLLRLNEDLSEAIAFAHDLGHPPFGHAGEKELNKLTVNQGGFEHNLQSLRIVDELEQKYPNFVGLNLSYEVRRGLLKHTKLLKGYPQFTHNQNSLEAQLVNIADEIAYNSHDIDDGLTANIITTDQLCRNVTLFKEASDEVNQKYTNLKSHEKQHLINSTLISKQMIDIVETTQKNINANQIVTPEDILNASHKTALFSAEMHDLNKELKSYLFTHLYKHPSVLKMNRHGQHIIQGLFDCFSKDISHLPHWYQARIDTQVPQGRVIADYISGMTDVFATKTFQKIGL